MIDKISRFFSKLGDSIKERTRNFISDKDHVRTAFFYSLIGIIPGLGQVFNKQWYKSIILWTILFSIILIELLSSRYLTVASELADPIHGAAKYQLTYSFFTTGDATKMIYFWRDYGGFFTKGLWGLFTLGAISNSVLSKYRGYGISIEIQDERPWTRYDDSAFLLGFGLIAFVIIIILLGIWISTIVDAYRSRKRILNNEPVIPFKEYIKHTYENLFTYIILIPAIILLTIFTLIPFMFSALVAFTNYRGGSSAVPLVKWTGFKTFIDTFTNQENYSHFLDTVLWTVIWAFTSSFTVYVLGFVNALLIESKFVTGFKIKLNKKKKISIFGKRFWRTIFILPWAIPSMISLMAYRNVFRLEGPANEFLRLFRGFDGRIIGKHLAEFFNFIGLSGVSDFPIYWFTIPQNGLLARAVVVVVNLWLGWPYHMLLITGVIATISHELFEAADIDGATGWQKFKHITLPQVLIATMPSIIMTFSFNFNNFGAIYYLTGGGPDFLQKDVDVPGQTDILISWIYKITFNSDASMYNKAAVYSILIFLVIGIFSVYNMSRTKLMQEEE